MAELPTGTVTLLFTDIEGSTRLLQRVGDDYAGLLSQHRSLLEEAFVAHGGVVVDKEGDAFFVAFASAKDAVAAAGEAQRALVSLLFSTQLTFNLGPVYIGALALTAIALWQITADGEATRFEGVALVAFYVIVAVLAWYE